MLLTFPISIPYMSWSTPVSSCCNWYLLYTLCVHGWFFLMNYYLSKKKNWNGILREWRQDWWFTIWKNYNGFFYGLELGEKTKPHLADWKIVCTWLRNGGWRIKKLSLIRCCLGSGSEDSHKKELQMPAYPYVGMGRPTTSLSLRPGPNHWGTLSLTGTFGGI